MILLDNLYGVVILYNPEESVIEHIKTYVPYLKKLYVMDNSDEMNEKCIKKICAISNKIEYKFLNSNTGIAYPINIVMKELKENDWLLTMDQDSYFYGGSFRKYIEILPKLRKNVYAISPQIRYKEKSNVKNKSFFRDRLKKLSKCIQSGAIFSVRIGNKVKGFNEDFYIDAVDTEYCYKCNKKGYVLYQYDKGILIHRLGNKIDNFRTKWLPFSLRQHNALRRYYIVRNNLYLKDLYPDEKIKILMYLFVGTVKIILFDDDINNKIKMMLKAYKDYKYKIKGGV